MRLGGETRLRTLGRSGESEESVVRHKENRMYEMKEIMPYSRM